MQSFSLARQHHCRHNYTGSRMSCPSISHHNSAV